jgi:hypothetical protein
MPLAEAEVKKQGLTLRVSPLYDPRLAPDKLLDAILRVEYCQFLNIRLTYRFLRYHHFKLAAWNDTATPIGH